MESIEEEEYVFFRTASADVDEALATIRLVDSTYPVRVQYALIRFSVICYMRPFRSANTKFLHAQQAGPRAKKIKLNECSIPSALIPLHTELALYRDSTYAHTDIDKRNPQLSYWKDSPFEFPIRFKVVESKPLHIHQSRIVELYEAVARNIASRLRSFEDDVRTNFKED
ncbi:MULTISPECIES: hypothetical protein [unclassified Pseudoxanthomonas]|uniref:hypothetical protein n=1 Tax=unclassified Pseudoxanthomonas TaxID=2645906 RepID=UPI003076B2DD